MRSAGESNLEMGGCSGGGIGVFFPHTGEAVPPLSLARCLYYFSKPVPEPLIFLTHIP
jgi:hypothetical protein